MARKKKETVQKEEQLLESIKDLTAKAPEKSETTEVVSSYVELEENAPLKPGDWISLNIRQTACFGLEQNGEKVIWLSRKNRSMQVPKNLTAKTLKDLYSAILLGDIVKGNVYISREDEDISIIEDYKKVLNLGGVDINDNIRKTLKETAKKAKINGIPTVKIFTEMHKYEIANRKRPKILEFLENLIAFTAQFHNVQYEAEEIGESKKLILNSAELESTLAESKKEVTEKTGMTLKKSAPTANDFSNLLKAI